MQKQCVKPALDYAKKRFFDLDEINIGRGAYAINKCLLATKAFHAASVFDPSQLKDMDMGKIIGSLHALKYFDFVTEEMIDGAVGDAEIVSRYVKRNFDLPHKHIHDHRVMMKLNEVKKKRAFRRIMQRRRNDIISKQVIEEEDNEGFEHLPDNILPQGVEFLRKYSVAVNKKAYTIMEW